LQSLASCIAKGEQHPVRPGFSFMCRFLTILEFSSWAFGIGPPSREESPQRSARRRRG
jgi:hypothetical protein